MCRNIRPLFNYDPQVTVEDIYNASEQFVRKVSGYNKPSKNNEAPFNLAINDISKSIKKLLDTLVTSAKPRNREKELERTPKRFSKS